jgi:YHS domain-containing protein
MRAQLIIASLCFSLIGTGYVFAGEGHNHGDKKGSMMMEHDLDIENKGAMNHKMDEENAGAVEVGNKICPVSGEKVGGDMGEIVKYEYKGKIYNLCCTMCAKDFKKDPEKYSKIAEEEVKQNQEDHADHGDESEEGDEHTGDRHDHDNHH